MVRGLKGFDLVDRNENRDGYKMTKIGWIPNSWSPSTLYGLVELQRGYDLPLSKRRSGMIPVIASNGKIATHDTFKVKGPGIVVGRSGSVGTVSFISENYWPLNTTLYSKNLKGNYPLFIFYFLLNLKLYRFANGTGVPTLNRNDIHPRRISIPPLPEQEKIADILSTWDKAVGCTQKLINAKSQIKKALMQKLIPSYEYKIKEQKSEWTLKNLGELIEPVSRPTPKPDKPYLSIGIRSHGKGTFQKIINEPEQIMMDTLYRIEEYDLVVNITFAWEGAIAIVKRQDSGGLVSHRFPTYRIKKQVADLNYVKNLIHTNRFIWDLGLISPGGAGRNRVMNKRDFLKIQVFVPPLEKQKHIGHILSQVEKDINTSKDYLHSLEKQKRGLMQKLLTGEIRVKV